MRARSTCFMAVALAAVFSGCGSSGDQKASATDGGGALTVDSKAGLEASAPSTDAQTSVPKSCKQSSECGKDLVCAPIGQCVPDCRVEKCPQQMPTCNQANGLCGPGGDGGSTLKGEGGLPPCKQTSECGKDRVCTSFGVCVPDCRIDKNCPLDHPTCDTKTGVCGGSAGDGGAIVPKSCKQSADCGKDLVCSPLSTCVADCRVVKACPSQAPTCDNTTGVCK